MSSNGKLGVGGGEWYLQVMVPRTWFASGKEWAKSVSCFFFRQGGGQERRLTELVLQAPGRDLDGQGQAEEEGGNQHRITPMR